MERGVRYRTTQDGVRIAYCVECQGPALVISPYLVESFALDHLVPEYKAFRAKHVDARGALSKTPESICNCAYNATSVLGLTVRVLSKQAEFSPVVAGSGGTDHRNG
jgi:hypothetical protein